MVLHRAGAADEGPTLTLPSKEVAEVLQYPSPHAERNRTAYWGMGLFLAGWAMTFGGLFFTYALLRQRAPSWPPLGLPPLPLLLPTLSTAAIGLSSVAFEAGLISVRRRRAHLGARCLLGCVVLGGLFLALQLMLAQEAAASGLTADRGGYAAVFYGFTVLHALHLVIGWVAVMALGVATFKGRYTPARHLPLRLWGLYWHFVGVVWALMYGLLFLL